MEPSLLVTVLAAPIRTSTWRRVAYAVVALPGVFVAPVWSARRLLDASAGGPVPSGRRILHAVASIPLNLVTLVVTGYVLAGIVLNLAYPIRVHGFPGVLADPLTPSGALDGAWGGPTLAGAWAFHGLVGGVVLFGIGGAWLIRGLTWLQRRLFERMSRT
ncbi:hypothetical protein [Flindersiella endophytica]